MTIKNKYFFQILFTLIIIIGNARCEVIETPDLVAIEEEIKKVDEKALVVFDIDNTLIIPSDMILRQNAKPLVKKILEKLREDKSSTPHYKFSREYLKSKVLKSMKVELVDPKITKIIQDLNERGIQTMALTNSTTGNFGGIKRLENLRINQLATVNIDFKKSFVKYSTPSFSDSNNSCLFKDGILFTAKQPKGKLLAAFLKKMNLKPSKVIFIDDNIKFIESVENEMKNEGIDTLCFHYTQVRMLPFRVDEKIAEFQLRNLREHSEWISDEEARDLHKSIQNAVLVAVGSKTGVKVKACKSALEKENVIITPCPARSKVQEQPLTEEETKQGAINRAKDCLAKTDAQLAFGLESGVFFKDEDVYLCNWGVLVDRSGKMFVTNSPNILMPRKFKDDLLSGKPLKEIIYDFTGMKTVDNDTCAIALFTNYALSREKFFSEIVKTLWEQYHYFNSEKDSLQS